MALPPGMPFDMGMDPESWPPTNATPIDEPAPYPGGSHPARVAKDGTRWCAYCDKTIDPATRVKACPRCASKRAHLRPGAHAD
jgi:hypothetical protein